MSVISKNKSDYIYIMKAIAVMSIVAAHCKLPSYSGEFTAVTVLLYITTYFGEVGVPIFLALSGYLFNASYSFITFIRKKTAQIILPWFFCSCLVWLYMMIQGDSYNIFSWVLGLNNIYWYMPILIVYFLVFYVLKDRRSHVVLFVASLVYHVLVHDFEFLEEIRVMGMFYSLCRIFLLV